MFLVRIMLYIYRCYVWNDITTPPSDTASNNVPRILKDRQAVNQLTATHTANALF